MLAFVWLFALLDLIMWCLIDFALCDCFWLFVFDLFCLICFVSFCKYHLLCQRMWCLRCFFSCVSLIYLKCCNDWRVAAIFLIQSLCVLWILSSFLLLCVFHSFICAWFGCVLSFLVLFCVYMWLGFYFAIECGDEFVVIYYCFVNDWLCFAVCMSRLFWVVLGCFVSFYVVVLWCLCLFWCDSLILWVTVSVLWLCAFKSLCSFMIIVWLINYNLMHVCLSLFGCVLLFRFILWHLSAFFGVFS